MQIAKKIHQGIGYPSTIEFIKILERGDSKISQWTKRSYMWQSMSLTCSLKQEFTQEVSKMRVHLFYRQMLLIT